MQFQCTAALFGEPEDGRCCDFSRMVGGDGGSQKCCLRCGFSDVKYSGIKIFKYFLFYKEGADILNPPRRRPWPRIIEVYVSIMLCLRNVIEHVCFTILRLTVPVRAPYNDLRYFPHCSPLDYLCLLEQVEHLDSNIVWLSRSQHPYPRPNPPPPTHPLPKVSSSIQIIDHHFV